MSVANTKRNEMIEKVKGFEGKNLYPSNTTTVATALTVLNYIYMHTSCIPKLSLSLSGKIVISYTNNKKSLIIEINNENIQTEEIGMNGTTKTIGNFKSDAIYEVVNKTKFFYNKKTDKMCLFTGAFNPPTIAHYHMIESATNAGNFDYVVFACSNQKFLDKKQAKTHDTAYSEEERIRFLLAMTRDCPNAIVFGAERGYTYDVLNDVNKKYQPKELYFALGSDKLKEIGRWGHHDLLLTKFCFYILQRADTMDYIKSKANELFNKTKYIVGTDNQKYKDVSATQVRNLIAHHETYKHLVTTNVYSELQKLN